LIIPDEAVVAEGKQAYVFVVQPDNSVLRTPITLGARQAATVEVISGLSAGAKVIRAGHQKLYDGAKVMPAGGPPPDSAPNPAAAETKP
jgi:membrane fusion protein (multidrug efflux system)